MSRYYAVHDAKGYAGTGRNCLQILFHRKFNFSYTYPADEGEIAMKQNFITPRPIPITLQRPRFSFGFIFLHSDAVVRTNVFNEKRQTNIGQ